MERVELIKEKLDKLQLEVDNLRNELEKSSKQKYPIYCKSRSSNLVVKFTEECVGEVVINDESYMVGHIGYIWEDCRDSSCWQQLEVCLVTGFFDGQAVWCWDDWSTHARELKFYNVRNTCSYKYNGQRDGTMYDNYEPFEGNYTEWMLKAFETLER